MLNTYVIEGGIGKQVAFTATIPKLKEKNGKNIQVFSSYIECFAYNPEVKLVLDANTLELYDSRILVSDNIIYPEPYKSNFAKGNIHLIESFCNLTGIQYDVSLRPKLYTDYLKDSVDEWLKKHKIVDYILVQFSGGQAPLQYTGNNPYVSNNPDKNYSPYFAEYIITQLVEKYKVTVIDCSLPNEPTFSNAIKCDLHWSQIHELMKNAKGWVGVDSCVNHFSASTGIPGVVVWGNTRWTQFGYMHNKNLTFHQQKEYNDYFTTDTRDPRNILVDPDLVLETFDKHVWEKRVQEVMCAYDINSK